MSSVRYLIEGDEVFYSHHYVGRQRLEGADAKTFAPLRDPIQDQMAASEMNQSDWHFAAKDKSSVWFMHTRIDEAEAASFRFFHGGQCRWGTDSAHIFCFYVSERPRVKVVRSKESASLRFLDEELSAYMREYALTDTRVYFYGRWVRGADPQSFRRIPKDRFDEPPEPSEVFRDDRFAYYRGRKLAGIDPDELVVFHHPSLRSRVYAVDRDNAYCVDSTRTPGRDVSGTPMTRLPLDEVAHLPQYQQLRDYIARRPDLAGYWFNRA